MSYEALMQMIQNASGMEVAANNQATGQVFQAMKDTRDYFTALRDRAWQKGVTERQLDEAERHTAAVEALQGRQVAVSEAGQGLQEKKFNEIEKPQAGANLGLTAAHTESLKTSSDATRQTMGFQKESQPFSLDLLKAQALKGGVEAANAQRVIDSDLTYKDRAGRSSMISAGAAASNAATNREHLNLQRPILEAQGDLAQQEVANQKSLQGMVDKEFQRRIETWKVQANAATQMGAPAPAPPNRQDAMDDVMSSVHSKPDQPALFKGGLQVGAKPIQYKVNSNGQQGVAQGFVPLEYEDNPEYAPQVFFPGMGWVNNPNAAQGAASVKPGFKIPGNPNANKPAPLTAQGLGAGVRQAGAGVGAVVDPRTAGGGIGSAIGGKLRTGYDQTQTSVEDFLRGLRGQ